jgi:hypothetical protein
LEKEWITGGSSAMANATDNHAPRRILSIDGGGIKGVFPLAFLAGIEEDLGVAAAQHFDLIAGTSTGGIIALGLGLGHSARELLEFYKELGPRVFRNGRGRLGWWLAPRYASQPLRGALEKLFGEETLGGSNTRLLIPAFDLERGEVYIYKTAHHPHLVRDWRQRVVDVAMATAAAPTFFRCHVDPSGLPLIDGGIWANNPVACAAVEAVGVLGWPREHVRILSLGCTAQPHEFWRAKRSRWTGLAFWSRLAVEAMMAGQSSGATGMAQQLLGRDAVVRVCPTASPGRFSLEAADDVEGLAALGSSWSRTYMPGLREPFFFAPAAKFRAVWPEADNES